MIPRAGLGFDVHPFGGEGPLVLGGVEIPGAAGLAGHSDADVVAHAVADSLTGPVGLPDLGALFPADDEQWRDADSMALLADVVARVGETGWRLSNVDVVVAAERPRLADHLGAMRDRLAGVLGPLAEPGTGGGAEPGLVSVTAKRSEGVGAVGRGEGIAAWAVSLVVRG